MRKVRLPKGSDYSLVLMGASGKIRGSERGVGLRVADPGSPHRDARLNRPINPTNRLVPQVYQQIDHREWSDGLSKTANTADGDSPLVSTARKSWENLRAVPGGRSEYSTLVMRLARWLASRTPDPVPRYRVIEFIHIIYYYI